MDEWVAIKEMARQGVSISEIGRRTGRDRNTVRKVLSETAPREHGRAARPRERKIDPFRGYLLGRIDEGCTNAAVLMEEIVRRGYGGRMTMLREFLHPIRQEMVRRREATERFETGPARQAQVDWADFGRIYDSGEGRWRRLYGFLFTLGYSRAMHLEFTTSADMEHFLACHIGAFGELGVPETVLYDNLKTGILGRRSDGSPIFPGRFLDFALYYGFAPHFCKPYRARTKGKVERGIGYVRGNFWVRVGEEVRAGRLELAGLNERASEWVEGVANRRVHGTHGQVVAERYAEEAALLGNTHGRPPYDTDYRSIRRVARDSRFSYRGRLYQLCLVHALSEVEVAESLEGVLTVRSSDGRVLRSRAVEAAAPLAGPVAPKRGPGVVDGGGELLRLLCHAEEVELRDLSVYEEVAHAAASTR
ncbi:MAG: IS21 family transposase [Bellilinea sp.]